MQTRQELERMVDGVVGPDRVEPGDDPFSVTACTVLLGEVVRGLYPDRLAAIAAAGRTVDDSVLDGRAVGELIGAAVPVRVTSWQELENRLEHAAEGSGRSTALILIQRGNGLGHALGAHRFADGQVLYFDPHRAVGQRVFEAEPAEFTLARASVVILDGTGREVIQPARNESSTVNALLDPVGDTRYGSGGEPGAHPGDDGRGQPSRPTGSLPQASPQRREQSTTPRTGVASSRAMGSSPSQLSPGDVRRLLAQPQSGPPSPSSPSASSRPAAGPLTSGPPRSPEMSSPPPYPQPPVAQSPLDDAPTPWEGAPELPSSLVRTPPQSRPLPRPRLSTLFVGQPSLGQPSDASTQRSNQLSPLFPGSALTQLSTPIGPQGSPATPIGQPPPSTGVELQRPNAHQPRSSPSTPVVHEPATGAPSVDTDTAASRSPSRSPLKPVSPGWPLPQPPDDAPTPWERAPAPPSLLVRPRPLPQRPRLSTLLVGQPSLGQPSDASTQRSNQLSPLFPGSALTQLSTPIGPQGSPATPVAQPSPATPIGQPSPSTGVELQQPNAHQPRSSPSTPVVHVPTTGTPSGPSVSPSAYSTVIADNRAAGEWLDREFSRSHTRGEPVPLSTMLAPKSWWRMYIDSGDHDEASAGDPDNPGSHHNSEVNLYQDRAVAAYVSVLDDADVLARPLTWAELVRMHSMWPGRYDVPAASTDTDTVVSGYRNLGAENPAEDLLTEHIDIGGLRLVHPVAVSAHGADRVPDLVGAVFTRLNQNLLWAVSPDEKLRAVARAARTLQVLRPFPDDDGSFIPRFVVPRLLLATGLGVTPAMDVLYSGAFTLDQMVAQLRWSLGREPSEDSEDDIAFGAGHPLRHGDTESGVRSSSPAESVESGQESVSSTSVSAHTLDGVENTREWLNSLVGSESVLGEPVALGAVVSQQHWRRIYASSVDRPGGLVQSEPARDGLNDTQFDQRMVRTYEYLNDAAVVQRPMTWGELLDMYVTITESPHTKLSGWPGYETTPTSPGQKKTTPDSQKWERLPLPTSHHLGAQHPAEDLLTEEIYGVPLVTPVDGAAAASHLSADTIVTLGPEDERGLRLLNSAYPLQDIPALVNRVFDQYYEDLSQADTRFEQFILTGQVVRTLHVLHPFRDAHHGLTVVLLTRLLLARGATPVALPADLFSGAFSNIQNATWIQHHQHDHSGREIDEVAPWRHSGDDAGRSGTSTSPRRDLTSTPHQAPDSSLVGQSAGVAGGGASPATPRQPPSLPHVAQTPGHASLPGTRSDDSDVESAGPLNVDSRGIFSFSVRPRQVGITDAVL